MFSFAEDEFNRLRAVADADGVALLFRESEVDHATAALKLSETDADVERRLAVYAQQHNALAISLRTGMCISSGAYAFRPSVTIPPEVVRELGWTEADLADLEQVFNSPGWNDIHHRGRSAIGRLCCHPGFLAETQALREWWRQLPDEQRPCLPLRRLQWNVPANPDGPPLVTPLLTEFGARFSAFLDRWQLIGMSAWDFPDPLEFHPVDRRYQPDRRSVSSTTTTISGLIALNKKDGRISDGVRQQHAKFRRERGIAGLDSKWKSYATIADIHRLERVLLSRLHLLPDLTFTETQLANRIGDFLQLDEDYVRRLRRHRDALRQGQISELPCR